MADWLLEHLPAIVAGALGTWTWHWWHARRTTWLIRLGRHAQLEQRPVQSGRPVPPYVDAIVDALAEHARQHPDMPDVTVRVERA